MAEVDATLVSDAAPAQTLLRRKASFLGNATFELGRVNPVHDYVIDGLMMFAAPIPIETVRKVVGERLLVYPRFRSVLDPPDAPGDHTWVEVAPSKLDLTYHVQTLEIPPPGDYPTLLVELGKMHAERMDSTKPLWRVFTVNLSDGSCVVLSRIHHAIGDGSTLIQVYLELYDKVDGKTPSIGVVKKVPAPLWKVLNPVELANRVWIQIYGTIHGLTLAGGPFDTQTSLKLKSCSDLTPIRRLAMSDSVPLTTIQEIKNAFSCTVNDVLTAVVAGVFRRALLARSELKPGMRLRMVFPYNTRIRPKVNLDDPSDFGNNFTLLTMRLPVDTADPIKRVRKVQRTINDLKVSPEAVIAIFLNRLGATLLPPPQYREATYQLFDRFTFLFTNVPASSAPVSFGGHPVQDCAFFVPALLSLVLTVISYNGRFRLGIMADSNVLPQPQELTKYFTDEIEELHALVKAGPVPQPPPNYQGIIALLVIILIIAALVFLLSS